jgi:hypothetical protein
LISVPKEQKKKGKLWDKRRRELIRVKSLYFCVKHKMCGDIFYATNQILQIQIMSENNKLTTQNIDVAFQLWVIGQQLELLSRTYKDLKNEGNSIKQKNSGADCWGNTVRRAVKNVRSNFEEFVGENADAGEDDYDLASVGQESGLDRIGLGGMWIFVALGIIKMWTGTWTPLNLKFLTSKVKTTSRLIWSGRKK